TTTLTSTSPTSVFGQPVTFTATVSVNSPASGTPTGTVNFYDGPTLLGPGTLGTVNGQQQATFTTDSLAVTATPHSITAVYTGTVSFAASTSAPLAQTVTAANTTTTLGASPTSLVYGQPVTFTATVSVNSPGAGKPTGVVNFLDG